METKTTDETTIDNTAITEELLTEAHLMNIQDTYDTLPIGIPLEQKSLEAEEASVEFKAIQVELEGSDIQNIADPYIEAMERAFTYTKNLIKAIAERDAAAEAEEIDTEEEAEKIDTEEIDNEETPSTEGKLKAMFLSFVRSFKP